MSELQSAEPQRGMGHRDNCSLRDRRCSSCLLALCAGRQRSIGTGDATDARGQLRMPTAINAPKPRKLHISERIQLRHVTARQGLISPPSVLSLSAGRDGCQLAVSRCDADLGRVEGQAPRYTPLTGPEEELLPREETRQHQKVWKPRVAVSVGRMTFGWLGGLLAGRRVTKCERHSGPAHSRDSGGIQGRDMCFCMLPAAQHTCLTGAGQKQTKSAGRAVWVILLVEPGVRGLVACQRPCS